jgi:hypothetical protein
LTFLAPAVLGGLGVVAAPIAIHFLNKARVQIVRWGAMRFLLETVRKNQRRLQVEDLILLLLRCLIVALLALAFARPVINPGGAGVSAVNSPAIAVLLFDQSASMGQSNGVETRFDEAKNAARKFLDQLGSGSQAALFLVADRVNQVVARPTADLALVRRALEVAEPSDRTSDLLAAVRLALDGLRPISGANKYMVLFTDNQAVAWKQLDAIKPLLAEAKDVEFRLVPLGNQGEENLAITVLRAEGATPAAGQLFGCVVEVSNFGATSATGVRVTLSLDEEAPADQAIIDEIAPGQSRAVRLNVRFARPGFQTVRATIPADRLPADNQRALAVQVLDQVRMTIVEGSQPAAKQDRDGFFLANALVPVPPARRAQYYLKVEAAPVSWIADADLSKQELIALCNAGAPGASAAQKLRQYVSNGGALLIFPGPNVKPDAYNNEPALKEILPATLGALKEPDKNGGFATWQPRGHAHAVTALWNDPQNGTLGSVRAGKFFPLTLAAANNENETPHAIVKYSDGSPAIVERTFGKGHVVLFSSTATTQWNNLPIHPDFVPLLRRLIGYVTHRDDGDALMLTPGAVFQQAVSSDLVGREFSVVRPDGKGKPQPAGSVELVNRQPVVRYRDTEKAGAYRLFVSGAEQPIAAFAVQMDPQESDLRVVAAERLAGLSAEKKTTAEAAAKPVGGVRREFWAALIAAAACIAVIEMMLAHKFSLAK